MLTCFYENSAFLQILLLVFSQFTLLSLVIGIVVLYKRGCKLLKISGVVMIFLVNVLLYVLMQLNSRITGAVHQVHLDIPYVVLVIIVALSLCYNFWLLINETRW